AIRVERRDPTGLGAQPHAPGDGRIVLRSTVGGARFRGTPMTVRRATYYSFGAPHAGLLINFTATVVIARNLTPHEIGIFTVSAAFVTLSQVIRDSGIANYLIQERDLTPERLRTAMGTSLVAGILLALAIVAIASPLAAFYGEPGVAHVLHILVFTFLL